MEIFSSKAGLMQLVNQLKQQQKTIGFVPTMGALHKGHISLVQKSVMETDVTIVSIFVNPTQFNDKTDLANYPRTLEADSRLLEQAGCQVIFAPSELEMYPEPDTRQFTFNGLDMVMEGVHRPGHFNGVAQVVSKLFEMVKPHKAYFGLKDFQQVAIIKQLSATLFPDIEIVPCPIVREADGLAMSSRNLLLTAEHRQNAPLIYQTLCQAAALIKENSVEQTMAWVIQNINQNPLFKVEYFEVVDINTLKPVTKLGASGPVIACIAVWAGKIRLIDNMIIN